METEPENILHFLSTYDPENPISDHQNPTSDETYAQNLQLQEVIVSSLTRTEHLSLQLQIPCEICAETKNDVVDFFPVLNCPHKFCTDCISKHVTVKVQNATIPTNAAIPCPCPGCKGWLEAGSCRAVVGPEVLVKWDRAACVSIFPPSQIFYCPYKSCSGMLVIKERDDDDDDDEGEIEKAECLYCNRFVCVKCRVRWHSGIGCEEFLALGEDEREAEDLALHELAKKNEWQRCPKCRFYVEKRDGCLHMMCRCAFQFCYACGEAWSSTHGGCR